MRTSSVELIILEILDHEQRHLTSQQVYLQIRDRLPAVNPSTVYRALERLVKGGKVSVSDMGFGPAVFESVHSEIHHHLVCQKCGQVDVLNHQEVKRFFDDLQQAKNFHVVTNHLILFGICSHCQDHANGENHV